MARYWFRQKTFGYGSTPNTWQGWLFTLATVLLIIGFAVLVPRFIADPPTRTLVQLGGMAAILVTFCWITYLKTEGGWRWRA